MRRTRPFLFSCGAYELTAAHTRTEHALRTLSVRCRWSVCGVHSISGHRAAAAARRPTRVRHTRAARIRCARLWFPHTPRSRAIGQRAITASSSAACRVSDVASDARAALSSCSGGPVPLRSDAAFSAGQIRILLGARVARLTDI